ncbi:MAG: TIGR04283 family arsenosugar biosynthesis glycosyltransferase [Hyphomicrobiales bacterium]|nr:TIGR04283 family arsenosugar biosynthesis glycosyltransferase [Hyphomicrobiales bacterium]
MENLSIIIPALNEGAAIAAALGDLADLRTRGAEIIVADGGSTDATVSIALKLCDEVVQAPRGRASQMNAGARAAQGDILLFLHADTKLPGTGIDVLMHGLASGHVWGRFNVRIEGPPPLLRLVAAMMNRRSRWTGIATGDQAMFMRREAFEAVGGFPDIPLMEDIEISKRLKRLGPPLCLQEEVTTSGRRWETNGVIRTILTMWRLRLAYFLGADPARLARQYGYTPREDVRQAGDT